MFNKKIIVRVGDKQIEDLEIGFKVILDEDENNTATITIHNLSKTTREEIKENDLIELIAGYEGNTAIIFNGQVKENRPDLSEGVKSVLRCIDKDFNIIKTYSKTFTSGTNEAFIRDIANTIGLTVRSITMDLIQNNLGRSFSDDGIELINLLSAEGNAKAKTNNNILDVVQGEGNVLAVIDAASGLIEAPKIKKEDGKILYTVMTLLDNRIIEGSSVKIISSDGEIILKTQEVIHEATEGSFITTIEGELIV